jgi:hypothetical protein
LANPNRFGFLCVPDDQSEHIGIFHQALSPIIRVLEKHCFAIISLPVTGHHYIMSPRLEEAKGAICKLCDDFEDLKARDQLALLQWAFSARTRAVSAGAFVLSLTALNWSRWNSYAFLIKTSH